MRTAGDEGTDFSGPRHTDEPGAGGSTEHRQHSGEDLRAFALSTGSDGFLRLWTGPALPCSGLSPCTSVSMRLPR